MMLPETYMDLRDDKRFWGIGEVLSVSWPASLSMLNATLMRFVEGLMISYIGPQPFAAQMIGSMAAFVPESFATGLLSVVNTYVSQNYGAGRNELCGRYTWAGLIVALAFCFCVVPLAFFAKPIFAFCGQPAELIDLEAMYFQFMVAAIFLTLTSRPLEQFFYGVRRQRVVLLASICSNVVNLVLGYILIFGRSGLIVLQRHDWLAPIGSALSCLSIFDFDGMGLFGAALATVISWGVQFLILLTIFLGTRLNQAFATRQIAQVRFAHCYHLLRVGTPAGLQFISDMLPWSVMLLAIIGPLGTLHVAASSVAMRWMPLSFMPAVGIGIATTALVGRYIGQGRSDLARRRTHAAMLLALAYMGACGLAFFFLREQMARLFVTVLPSADITPQQAAEMGGQIVAIGGNILICAAVFQLFDALGIVFIGALRGAGDTFVPMLATISLSLSLLIGGGYATVRLLPQLASIGPWMAASLYVMVLGTWMIRRFESGKWQRINLLSSGT